MMPLHTNGLGIVKPGDVIYLDPWPYYRRKGMVITGAEAGLAGLSRDYHKYVYCSAEQPDGQKIITGFPWCAFLEFDHLLKIIPAGGHQLCLPTVIPKEVIKRAVEKSG
jgi:hypothetical protein